MKDTTKHLKICCCNYALNKFSAIIQALRIYMKGYFQASHEVPGFRIYSLLCKKDLAPCTLRKFVCRLL